MMKTLLVLGWLLCGVIGLSAADGTNPAAKPAATQEQPFELRLSHESIPNVGNITRGLIEGETNQITFVLPKGFRAQPEAAKKRVSLKPDDNSALITVSLEEPVGNPEEQLKDREKLRQRVESSYPKAGIVDEYIASSGISAGVGFELQQAASSNIIRVIRVVYVPLQNGILEASLITNTKLIEHHDSLFNRLMLSLRSSPKGVKPEFRPFIEVN